MPFIFGSGGSIETNFEAPWIQRDGRAKRENREVRE